MPKTLVKAFEKHFFTVELLQVGNQLIIKKSVSRSPLAETDANKQVSFLHNTLKTNALIEFSCGFACLMPARGRAMVAIPTRRDD